MPIKFLNDVAVDDSVLYVDTINDRVGIGTTSPATNLDVSGRAIIGLNNNLGTNTDLTIIGNDNDATNNTIIDSNTNVVLGDASNERYGNIAITDRTLRLGRADNITATSANTTGVLNFNDSVQANQAFSNVGGFIGYFPPPTETNDYYFFNAYSENVLDSSFQAGASPTASRINMSTSPTLNCIGYKFDANTTNGGGVYYTVSNNSATPSSRGIVTFDVRHQNQNYTVPDGHSLFEITSGYGQTKFLIKQVSGSTNVGIGTTSPSQKLHVSGSARVTGAYYDSSNSAGTSGQILSSTATGTDWIDQGDVIAGEADKAKSVVLRVKNSTASAMTKGQVICEAVSASPPSGNLIEVALADNNGTNTMPALGILNEDLDAAGGANDEGDAIMFGKVSGIDTSAFSVGDEVFVSDTPGGLTITKPTGVKYIQKVGVVIRDDASNGTIEVFGAGRVNDVPTPLYVDHANQRLGIGITNPQTKLHIGQQIGSSAGTEEFRLESRASSGFGGTSVINLYTGTYGGAGVYFGDNATYSFQPGKIEFLDVASSLSYDSPQKHYWKIGGATKMTLNNSNVGIGTTSPNQKLTIKGTDQYVAAEQTNYVWGGTTTIGVKMGTDATAGLLDFRRWIGTATTHGTALITQVNSDGGYGLDFRVDNKSTNTSATTSRMFLSTSGEVGIGTTSPTRKLHVQGDNNNDPVVRIVRGNNTAQYLDIRGYQIQGRGNHLLLTADDTKEIWLGQESNNQRMVIDSSGNVGIGATSPRTKLHVSGLTGDDDPALGSSTAPFFVSNTANSYGLNIGVNNVGASWLQSQSNTSSTAYDLLLNPLGGDVGIGTTSPGYKLDVNGSIASSVSSGFPELRLSDAVSDFLLSTNSGGDGVIKTEGTSKNIRFFNNSGETMRISGAGNVGIGTTSPGEKLHVNGATQVDNGGLLLGGTSSVNGNNPQLRRANSSNDLRIATGGSDRVTILGGGNVGIGTTDPRVPLQVSSSAIDTDFLIECGNTQARMSINNTSTGDSQINFQLSNSSKFTIGVDNSDSDKFKISAGSSLGSSDRIVVDSTGNVGIGTTSPSEKLQVNGNIKAAKYIGQKTIISWYGYHSTTSTVTLLPGGMVTIYPYAYSLIATTFDGKVNRVVIKNQPYASYSSGPTGSSATLYLYKNGTQVASDTVTYTPSGARQSIIFDFTSNNTFTAGDGIEFTFSCNGIWRYTSTTIELQQT